MFRRSTLIFTTFVLTLLLSPVAAQAQVEEVTLRVDGLACPFCAYGIEKQLNAIEGVESAETEIKSGSVVITMQDGAALDEAAARKAVDAAGFTMRAFKRAGTTE